MTRRVRLLHLSMPSCPVIQSWILDSLGVGGPWKWTKEWTSIDRSTTPSKPLDRSNHYHHPKRPGGQPQAKGHGLMARKDKPLLAWVAAAVAVDRPECRVRSRRNRTPYTRTVHLTHEPYTLHTNPTYRP